MGVRRFAGTAALSTVLMLSAFSASAAAALRFPVHYRLVPDQVRTIVIAGTLPPPASGALVDLGVIEHGRFRQVATVAAPRPNFRFQYVAPVTDPSTLTLRVRVRRGGKVIALSPVHKLVFRSSYAQIRVPPFTREYQGAEVSSVKPGSTPAQAVVVFKRGAVAPVVGGHVAIGPSPGLPYGMFATVVSARSTGDGGVDAVLRQAPLVDVLPGIRYGFDGAVKPRLVDASGHTVPNSSTGSGGVVIRGHAASSAGGVFDCKSVDEKPGSGQSSGATKDASELWNALLGLPLDITIQNTRVLHTFDGGSFFPKRPPSLLFQFSGEAVASIGFEAKTGFSCELSANYRKNHRIVFPIRNIGDVPVVAYLEPTLKFEVSAAGKFTFEQKHYFAITLEKQGSSPISFRLAHSADRTKPSLTASLDATMFAGGDLALLVGGSADGFGIGAGLDGAFGPQIALSTSSSQPGCVTATAKLEADLAIRLEVWTPAWDHQDDLRLGSLSSAPAPLLDSPYCLPGYNTPAPGTGPAAPPTGPSSTTPPSGPPSPWMLQATPNVGGSSTDNLSGVACTTATSCIAVGSGGGGTLAEAWNGTTWSIEASPNPVGRMSSALHGISCISQNACTAVGASYDGSNGSETLVEFWNGSTWSIQTSPNVSGALMNDLAGVSCTSATSCLAVGNADQSFGDNASQQLIESWDGTSWSIQPAPAVGSNAVLSAVSCTSVNACTLVGSYGGRDNVIGLDSPLAETLIGTTWTSQQIPLPPGGQYGYLNSISCTAPSACHAVGSYNGGTGTHFKPLAESWDGSAWMNQALPLWPDQAMPDSTSNDYLFGISCISATACTAVGFGTTLAAESLSAGTWSTESPPSPPEAQSGRLQAVSCASAPSCIAVGYVTLAGGSQTTLPPAEPLAESRSG